MPSISLKSNFRIEVIPKSLGDYGSVQVSDSWVSSDPAEIERLYKARCDEIARDIHRHVNDVAVCYVVRDEELVCVDCGREWETEPGAWNCVHQAIEVAEAWLAQLSPGVQNALTGDGELPVDTVLKTAIAFDLEDMATARERCEDMRHHLHRKRIEQGE